MTIRPETTVAEIATTTPATIRVFQQHHIDFCCGGKIPLDAACKARGLDLDLPRLSAMLDKVVSRHGDQLPGTLLPLWASPTFRGLYYGLAQLETEMHVHVHLENNVLFPRALQLAKGHRTN